jgi:hypothetical protein
MWLLCSCYGVQPHVPLCSKAILFVRSILPVFVPWLLSDSHFFAMLVSSDFFFVGFYVFWCFLSGGVVCLGCWWSFSCPKGPLSIE